jgi:hypothetical protein
LEVDVSSLKKEYRDLISEFVGDDGQLKTAQGSLLAVPTPNLEGLFETLDSVLAERAKRVLEAEQLRVRADAEIAKAIANFDAGITKAEVSCEAINRSGTIEYVRYQVGVNVVRGSAPTVGYCCFVASASPDTAASYKAAQERSERIRHEVFESLKPLGLKKLLEAEASAAAEQAKNDAARARLKAQIEKTVQMVGGIFAERYAAGYSSEQEVIVKICELEREARHLTFTGDFASDWGRSVCEEFEAPLCDQQFNALKEFQAKLPDKTEVAIYEIFDYADADGCEDKHSRINRILIADAAWKVGGVEVKADCQIGELPDISQAAAE